MIIDIFCRRLCADAQTTAGASVKSSEGCGQDCLGKDSLCKAKMMNNNDCYYFQMIIMIILINLQGVTTSTKIHQSFRQEYVKVRCRSPTNYVYGVNKEDLTILKKKLPALCIICQSCHHWKFVCQFKYRNPDIHCMGFNEMIRRENEHDWTWLDSCKWALDEWLLGGIER